MYILTVLQNTIGIHTEYISEYLYLDRNIYPGSGIHTGYIHQMSSGAHVFRMYLFYVFLIYSTCSCIPCISQVYSKCIPSVFTSIVKCIHVARREYSILWCIVTLYSFSIPASPVEYIYLVACKHVYCEYI